MGTPMTVGARVLAAREQRGLTRDELAKAAKIPYSTLADLEQGRSRSTTKLASIAAVLGVDPLYLETGRVSPGEIREVSQHYVDDGEFVWVPLLRPADEPDSEAEVDIPYVTTAHAAAGAGSTNAGSNANVALRFRRESLRRKGIDPATAIVINVRGDSMEPLLSDGDQIMFDSAKRTIRDGDLYVVRIDGEEVVKRLLRRPGGRLVVQSENPAFPPFEIDPQQPGFDVLGQVVWRAGWV